MINGSCVGVQIYITTPSPGCIYEYIDIYIYRCYYESLFGVNLQFVYGILTSSTDYQYIHIHIRNILSESTNVEDQFVLLHIIYYHLYIYEDILLPRHGHR